MIVYYSDLVKNYFAQHKNVETNLYKIESKLSTFCAYIDFVKTQEIRKYIPKILQDTAISLIIKEETTKLEGITESSKRKIETPTLKDITESSIRKDVKPTTTEVIPKFDKPKRTRFQFLTRLMRDHA